MFFFLNGSHNVAKYNLNFQVFLSFFIDVLLDIADLNLETIPGSTLDIVPENMDSEDLVPSIQVSYLFSLITTF